MNWIDIDSVDAVTYERIQIVSGLTGFQPGRMAEIAVLGEPLRLGLGKQSWWDLAHRLNERDIACEISGCYWTHWSVDLDVSRHTDWTVFKIEYEAQAHVRMFRDEDVVRFERAALRAFGRPARMGLAQTVTRQEVERDLAVVGYVGQQLLDQVLRSVGPRPGQHLSLRLPVDPYTRK
jgi:hypothetical protein